MYELDDVLQHFGVKGMKWGVVKKSIKDHAKKRRAKEHAMLKKYHNEKLDNVHYRRSYIENRNKTDDHIKAIRRTRNERRTNGKILAVSLAVLAAHYGGPKGAELLSKFHEFAVRPENIRRGKNVIEALMRSSIRYVDGSTMTNVINI